MTTTVPTTSSRPVAFVATIAVVVLLLGLLGAFWLSRVQSTATVVQPLAGMHTCDTQTAVAYPATGGGVTVFVHAPGPDVVTVGIITGPGGLERRQVQQVTAKGTGANFTWWNTNGVSAITVMSKKFGLCNLPVPVQ